MESGPGKIRLFSDFTQTDPVAGTGAVRPYGDFIVVGQGSEAADSGVPALQADALSGVGVLTTTDEVDHSILVGTSVMWNVGLMGTIVAEARVRLVDLDLKEIFFGFVGADPTALSIQVGIAHGATTVLTLVDDDICGFLLSAELTEDEMWHSVFNGGTTTGQIVSTPNEMGVDAVAGEWDFLRLEIDNNGTARFTVNGDLKQTVEGAVSTSVDLAAVLGVEAKTAVIEIMHADYLLMTGNRDWTR